MAAREEQTVSPAVARYLMAIGDEIASFDAIANRHEITEASESAGRIASSVGDYYNLRPTVEFHQHYRTEPEQGSWLDAFRKVVGTTLDWLETTGRIPDAKQEQVLRGLYNLTELANHANLFAIMEVACSFLVTSKDPFPGVRQYIVQCFEDVQTQQVRIQTLVNDASLKLNEILEHEGVDYLKGRQFDNIVREANVLIESCGRRLTGAKAAISELSQKMSTVKWASRGMRATTWVFSGCVAYKRYTESSRSWMDLLQLGGLTALLGYFCMCLLPGQASEYYESLPKLEADHRALQDKLEDLRISLKSAKDHRDGL